MRLIKYILDIFLKLIWKNIFGVNINLKIFNQNMLWQYIEYVDIYERNIISARGGLKVKRRKFLRKTVAGALVFVMCSTNTMYVAKSAVVYASQELNLEAHTNVRDVDANILLVNNGQKANNIVADVSR